MRRKLDTDIIARTEKATGRNSSWWNIETNDGAKISVEAQFTHIENENTAQSNSKLPPKNDDLIINDTFFNAKKEGTLRTKKSGLNRRKEQKVHEEITDVGLTCKSLRWVVKPNLIDGIMYIEGRLCARGFEEEESFRTDSLTCAREGIRIVVSMIAANSWTQQAIKCSKLTVETLEQGVKYVQS